MAGVDYGIVFDIDGVLMRSDKLIPEAKSALHQVIHHKIPHLFVTNGGGTPEDEKLGSLKREFGVDLSLDQMICAHTPLKDFTATYRHERVLLVNKNRRMSLKIAETYGFQNVVCLEDFAAARPWMCPWKSYTVPPEDSREQASDDIPFKAIFVLHEPLDWSEGIQIIVDVLRSNGVVTPTGYTPSEEQKVALFMANPDFTYASHYEHPRFTNGAFLMCLETLFQRLTGRPLCSTVFGKPFREMHEFAERQIEKQAGKHLKTVYMIGDNPHSDIQGANGMEKWFSVLVKTGVFKGETNHDVHPADAVFENVSVAIDFILAKEGTIGTASSQ